MFFNRICFIYCNVFFWVRFNLHFHLPAMKALLLRTLLFAGTFAICPVISSRANPITAKSRLWFEWNMVPSTQWAPKTIDSKEVKGGVDFYNEHRCTVKDQKKKLGFSPKTPQFFLSLPPVF